MYRQKLTGKLPESGGPVAHPGGSGSGREPCGLGLISVMVLDFAAETLSTRAKGSAKLWQRVTQPTDFFRYHQETM